jgi:hypothetical protein
MTQEQKWFNALLILVRFAWQTCNIEVLGSGLFTLHPLRLIARELAILILRQQNVIMDTSLGCQNSGIKIKNPPKFLFPRSIVEVLIRPAAFCIWCLLVVR